MGKPSSSSSSPPTSSRAHIEIPIEASENIYVAPKRKSYQFKALFYKNFSLQKRQLCQNCCQLLVPLLLVTIVGLVEVLFDTYFISKLTIGKQVMTSPDNYTFPNSNPYSYDVWYTSNSDLGELTMTGNHSGFLGLIPQVSNGTAYFPYFDQQENYNEMLQLIFNNKSFDYQYDIANLDFPPDCSECPKSALNISYDYGSTDISYTVLVDFQASSPLDILHTMINMIDTALIKSALNITNFRIDTLIQEMPYYTTAPPFDVAAFMSIILYPFAVSFLLPLYINTIVLEKQERLRELMKMMGMKMSVYWLVNYLYDFFLYVLVFLVIILTSLAFQMRMFTQTSWILLGAVFLGWGLSQIALSFLFSTFFSKARSATIVSWLLVIGAVIISYVLNYTVFNNTTMPFWPFFLYAPFACYRALYLIGLGCSFDQCVTLDQIVVGGQLFWIMILLFIDTVLYIILALYLDAVLPQEFGVPKHPLFFLDPIKNLIKKKRAASDVEGSRLFIDIPLEHNDEEVLNPDVASEEKRVRENNYVQDSPIVVFDLKKTYPSQSGQKEKRAVKGISFVVEKSQCFGLLGPNGAGKTTTISMLTGLYRPTSGTAKIGGYDIGSEMDQIHTLMSVCPQFDTLWTKLTCQETLLFYARLKGIPSSEEEANVKQTLIDVGLEQYKNRKSADLSGGMRRRLSIAISLVGDPQVIFLDEPTTGLDPDTRRSLWNVLLKIKKGRSLILTTHSMEEADILCNRIGIMDQGRLQCIGSSLHLKNNYGLGYTLSINMDRMYEQSAKEFISRTFPEAKLVFEFAQTATYQIPREHVSIPKLFRLMPRKDDEEAAVIGIRDWGISQTTLEDVFLALTKDDVKAMNST